ncbi:WD-repeat protein [Serendipita vermifera]|nr:WD-repeat protein [Serendipita vermifera]
MATLLPPPKRRKIYHGIPEPQKAPEAPVSNIVVQFVNEEDGAPLAPAVNLPADLSRDGLETLLNKLSNKEDDPVPFAFHVAVPTKEGEDAITSAPTRTVIANSLQQDVLLNPKHPASVEDIFVVYCSPQAVFKVRPATRCSSTLTGHTSPILCAAFSPTGRMLATGSGDCNARLWDLDTETPSYTLIGHKGWVLCVEWEARERKLASGGHDGQVRIWDPNTGKAIGDAMKGHTLWVTSLAWEPIHINPINPRLASSSKDCTVRIWSLTNRRTEYTLGGHTASVNIVRWGGALATGVLYTASSDRTIRIWEAQKGRCLHILKDHAHWVTTLSLNTDFALRTGPFDHTARQPSSDDEARKMALERYQKIASANSELMISGSDDHTLYLWNPFASVSQGGSTSTGDAAASGSGTEKKPKPTTRLTGHQRQISHVVFSPDGKWAASASWDSSVRLWDGRTGKFIATLRGHIGAVYRLTWSADSRMLVSASKDSTVKIWNLKTYKLKTDLPGHEDEVYCVDFVADKIVSGGRDRTVKIWKN